MRFASILPSLFAHPLGYCSGTAHQIALCRSYNFYSGLGSDLGEISILVGAITITITVWRLLHKHLECHEETCHRIGLHRVSGTPHRTCWAHHPILSQHPRHGVPLHAIRSAHAEANPQSTIKDKP